MIMVMPLAVVIIDITCDNTNGIVGYNAMAAGEQSKQKTQISLCYSHLLCCSCSY